MMPLVMSSVLVLAAVQSAAINSAREGLRNCFKEAITQAKTDKVAKDGFQPFAKTRCTAQSSSFTAAIWAFDAKNKVSKKQSEKDAEFQIEDFVTSAADRYAMDTSPQ